MRDGSVGCMHGLNHSRCMLAWAPVRRWVVPGSGASDGLETCGAITVLRSCFSFGGLPMQLLQ